MTDPRLARYEQRLEDFSKALLRLQEALAAPDSNIKQDAVIQRFEFTYEAAWKTAKLWLEISGITALTPLEVLREALKVGLLLDGNLWTQMQKNRNLTVHTYDEAVAAQVYNFIRTEAVAAFAALLAEFNKRPVT